MIRTLAFLLIGLFSLTGCQTVEPPRSETPPRDERAGRQERPNRGERGDRSRRQGRSSQSPFEAPVLGADVIPLTDMVAANGQIASYKGFVGGLYPGGNELPASHAAFGMTAARQIQPLDATGSPSSSGRIVVMSITMSNATREFCHAHSSGAPGEPACTPESFMGQAEADPTVSDNVFIVNGARSGQDLSEWERPTASEYERIARDVLPAYGVTERQVQVVWVKVALKDESSRPLLPDPGADAFLEERAIGNVIRALRDRYPNLKQVFFSSRVFGGWSDPQGNSPEPWAYETGFGTKWAIEAQIRQRDSGVVDPQTGNLDGTPFMAWGPYLWSYADRPREDGLMWPRHYFEDDGIHVSPPGRQVVGEALLSFFKTEAYTRCWFVEGLSC